MAYCIFLILILSLVTYEGNAFRDSGYCVGPYCPNLSFPDRYTDSSILCNTTREQYFKDPEDCRSYYFCSGETENATKLICPKSYGYHEEWNICVPENQVKLCGAFYCPAYIYDGVMPDPKDCTRFYRCHYGFPKHHKCPRRSTYDPESGLCKVYQQGKEPACLKKPDQPTTTATIETTSTSSTSSETLTTQSPIVNSTSIEIS